MNIITTMIDENPVYWDLLLAFLTSMEKNSPNSTVIVNTINVEEPQVKLLNKFWCVLKVQKYHSNETTFQKNYLRFKIIPSIMRSWRADNVAWIDPDCLIRGSIKGLFNNMFSGLRLIKYRHKDNVKEQYQFQGGVFVLIGHHKSIDYCRSIYEKLEGTDDWMLPQLLALRQIKESGLIPLGLDKKYNDSNFNDDSLIWHAKTSRRDNEKYKKEFKKYLNIGKEIISE